MADANIIALTADIVSAHVSNNQVASADLPALIESVFTALDKTTKPTEAAPEKREPAVPIRSSIKPDYIVCLEDGAKVKMLKRYLRSRFDLSPDDYRAKWGLPRDYPMTAPNYAERRRLLAQAIGLGRKKVVETATAVVEEVKHGTEVAAAAVGLRTPAKAMATPEAPAGKEAAVTKATAAPATKTEHAKAKPASKAKAAKAPPAKSAEPASTTPKKARVVKKPSAKAPAADA